MKQGEGATERRGSICPDGPRDSVIVVDFFIVCALFSVFLGTNKQ